MKSNHETPKPPASVSLPPLEPLAAAAFPGVPDAAATATLTDPRRFLDNSASFVTLSS